MERRARLLSDTDDADDADDDSHDAGEKWPLARRDEHGGGGPPLDGAHDLTIGVNGEPEPGCMRCPRVVVRRAPAVLNVTRGATDPWSTQNPGLQSTRVSRSPRVAMNRAENHPRALRSMVSLNLGRASAKVTQMRIDITPGRGRISVGPPGGPTETIPASVTVTITDTVPYDVEARLEWSPTVGKLAVRKVCCTALPGGDDVSPTGIARIALRDTIQAALEAEYLGGTGWPGLVDKYRDARPARRRRVDLPARRRLPELQAHRHRRTRPRPLPGQRTQASARRPQGWTAPRDRTRQARWSLTGPPGRPVGILRQPQPVLRVTGVDGRWLPGWLPGAVRQRCVPPSAPGVTGGRSVAAKSGSE